MEKMTFKELRDFYKGHLFNVIVPFWMRFGIDRENGSFFTCFNNAGDKLLSKHKYVWSQGRFLWMLSRLYYGFKGYVDEITQKEYLHAAEKGAKFLKQYAILPNGNCAWVLDEKGNPILVDKRGVVRKAEKGEEYDLGIGADQFLVYGMGEYARASGDSEYFDFALELFDSVIKRLKTGSYKTAPHFKPSGFKTHGESMIMLETAQELANIARFFEHPSERRLLEVAKESMHETLNNFVIKDEKILLEMLREDNRPATETMLGSYVNPGHSLEDAWFIMHFAKRVSDKEAMKTAVEIVRWMTTLGWDPEFGGLFQFVHKNGGKPKGYISEENKNDHMIMELSENWDNKLWWVHSEALYALILAYENSGDEWFMKTYWKFHEYVFKTFPNPNREIGEWIQIRNRRGNPEDKVVALPVKDPYHISRAFMHIIKSLERLAER